MRMYRSRRASRKARRRTGRGVSHRWALRGEGMGEGHRAGALRASLLLILILGWLNLTTTLTGTISRRIFFFSLTCLYSYFTFFTAFFLFYFFSPHIQSYLRTALRFVLAGGQL